MQRHITWKLINYVCQIHSNCFPIRKCPLVQIVDFLLFAVSLKPSHGCLESYLFFSWLEKDAYMWREFTAELLKNGKRFLRHLSRSFFLQEAPFKRLSGRTRKRMYHIWYICCGIWIFLGWEKYQWMSSVFWREERNFFHQSVARLLHEHMLPKKVVGRFP